jgi:hypothetical protein
MSIVAGTFEFHTNGLWQIIFNVTSCGNDRSWREFPLPDGEGGAVTRCSHSGLPRGFSYGTYNKGRLTKGGVTASLDDVDFSANAARIEYYRFGAIVVLFAERHLDAEALLKSKVNAYARSEVSGAHDMADAIAQPIAKFGISVQCLPVFSSDRGPSQDRQERTVEGELPIIHHEGHGAKLF